MPRKTREKRSGPPAWDPQWDLAAIRKALDKEEWEEDSGSEYLVRSISLGSVFSLTPSGKYYMPFACSNLKDCPVCGGTGEVAPGIKRRIVRKWKNENRRRRRLWVKRWGAAFTWPARILAASDALNRKLARTRGECPRCGGCGSHEAYDDERWREKTEDVLSSIGVSLETSEGDSTWLLASEWKEKEEGEEASDEVA